MPLVCNCFPVFLLLSTLSPRPHYAERVSIAIRGALTGLGKLGGWRGGGGRFGRRQIRARWRPGLAPISAPFQLLHLESAEGLEGGRPLRDEGKRCVPKIITALKKYRCNEAPFPLRRRRGPPSRHPTVCVVSAVSWAARGHSRACSRG